MTKLIVTDVTPGWVVRIRRLPPRAGTFVAFGTGAAGRAFFMKHRDALQFVKDLRDQGICGHVTRARVVLEVAA